MHHSISVFFAHRVLRTRTLIQARTTVQTTGRFQFQAVLLFLWMTSLVISPMDAADVQVLEPLEPEIAEASEEPRESMAGIRVREGWQIDLFAAEPDVANVVAFDFDRQGRLYVCETYRQTRGVTDNRAHDDEWLKADLAAQTVQDRIDYHKRLLGDAAVTFAQHDDRIRRLVDTDGDGRADESIVIANGFNRLEEGTGAGILVRDNEVYYTCIPKLWKLVDQDRDGVIDERVVMSNGYGVRVAFRGHDLHGLLLGPDGRLYFSIGDRGYHVTTEQGDVLANPAVGAVFRCELDGSDLEVYCNGLRNPQELAFNDQGDLFTVDNNSDSGDEARIVHLLQHGDSGWRMYYQYLADRGPFNRDKLWEPLHPEQPAYIVPPIVNFTDGPSGLAYYPGTGFGDTLKDTFLICDFRGGPSNSGVRSFRLESDGAFYRLAEDGEPIWTLLATDVGFGPDGGLYVSDWVNGWNGLGKGRIYRISDPRHEDSDIVREVQTLLASDWRSQDSQKLAGLLDHVDRRIRLEAQWELARRGDVQTLLGILISDQENSLSRLHSIWGVDQIIRRDDQKRNLALSAVRDVVKSDDEVLRAAAVKFLGERGDQSSVTMLTETLSDSSSRVRYFAAVALGQLKHRPASKAIVSLLEANNNADPAIRHAGIMFMVHAMTENGIAALSEHQNAEVRRAAVVALRRINSGKLASFLEDPNPLVLAEAVRAIHDAPVSAALVELASLIEKDLNDNESTLRVLNANYRLGTPEAAAAVASYAGRVSAPVESRLEALEMLVDWAALDGRDRVLNDFRPLPERSAKIAAEALKTEIEQLMSSKGDIRERAVDVASKLGLKVIVPNLLERIGDAERSLDERANALIALSRLDSALAVESAQAISVTPPTVLTDASLTVLAEHDAINHIQRFIEASQSPRTNLRQLAWDILGSLPGPPENIKDAMASAANEYLAGDLPAELELNFLEAVKGKLPPAVQTKMDSHQAKLAESQPLAPWWASRAGGDVEKGAKLFFGKTELSCVRCHKVDRAGGEVGPNLTVIGKDRDSVYLLEAICIPDATIAKGFETAVIADEDGQVFTGIVKNENDDFVELIAADGSQIKIEQDAIEFRRKGKSSMPSDLTKSMTARELRDLVAYLSSLKVDPRASDDVE